MSAKGSNPSAKIAEQINNMVDDKNLTTRSGLRLIISVFGEAMTLVGNMDQRISDLENAYVRFTNASSAGKTLEEENRKTINEMVPLFKAVKWIGVTLGTLILALIWSLLTGKAIVSWK